jgi:DNA (cytosine-5)-methyltransferase 1
MNELALFAGAGGGILGGKLLGWRTVCAVEWDAYAASVLVARQNDKTLEPFPIWDDVQTFDGRPWRGRVDVISGGFPCQDISAAGKGAGIDGERSGMWSHMARIVGEVLPRFVFVENSPMLVGRGLARVVGDLTALGYDCKWGVLGADDVGAPHERKRLWLVANANGSQDNSVGADRELGRQSLGREKQAAQQDNGATDHNCVSGCSPVSSDALADTDSMRQLQPQRTEQDERGWVGNSSQEKDLADSIGERLEGVNRSEFKGLGNGSAHSGQTWWGSDPADDPKSGVGRMVNGVANRVDRLKAIGNGQVPAVVRLAWETLAPIGEIGATNQ